MLAAPEAVCCSIPAGAGSLRPLSNLLIAFAKSSFLLSPLPPAGGEGQGEGGIRKNFWRRVYFIGLGLPSPPAIWSCFLLRTILPEKINFIILSSIFSLTTSWNCGRIQLFGKLGQACEQSERRVEGKREGQSKLHAGLLVPAPPEFPKAQNSPGGSGFSV